MCGQLERRTRIRSAMNSKSGVPSHKLTECHISHAIEHHAFINVGL
jgi:hypothetical protein